MSIVSRLTVGVIARNGMPFLQRCLASLDDLDGLAEHLEFVLVDCLSDDGTGSAMRAFADAHPGTRVYRVDGSANAAIARNVVLNHAHAGSLLLLDGDVAVNREFLAQGLAYIVHGQANAVTGRLAEQRHDGDNHPLERVDDIMGVNSKRHTRIAGGVLLLGPAASASGLRYDESLPRNEDRDFALRLSERYSLWQIPVSMGLHLTRRYYHPSRLDAYYRESYQRPVGTLIRKHIARPARVLAIVGAESGLFFGLALQTLIVAGLLASWLLLALTLLAVGCDVARFALQRRIHEYLPIRVWGPWMFVAGLFGPRELAPSYTVTPVA
ncbi:MAG TPA: glycosyltransferase family 2 protein [Candidatus Cybelea sp.]|nr:glycosyltransferase family 2 protein [Candidatus Cybelea sp.]